MYDNIRLEPRACVTAFFDVRGSAGRGQFVKMLITLQPEGIFGSSCIPVYLNIFQPLVCKTVTRLLVEFKA